MTMVAVNGLLALLPWLCGAIWIRGCWRGATVAGFWPMALGYGYVLGMLAATLLLRLLDWLAIPLNFVLPASVLVVLTIVLVIVTRWIAWRRQSFSKWGPVGPVKKERRPRWERVLWVLLLVWLAMRLVGLALESFWLPLFPWDAWSTWMVRPQAWLIARQLLSFRDAQTWLEDTTGLIYHIEAWRYPLTVSLIALWSALAWGQWHEAVVSMSWGCAGLALGLGFYGQARLWGATPLQGLLFTWLLLSLPLLDVHIALAGYADLWLATVFSLAAIGFMQWVRFREPWQGILALVLALFCPSIKQEGLMWLLLFAPALLVVWLPKRYLLGLVGLVVIVGALWFLTPGTTLIIPGLGEFRLIYWNSWQAVIESFLILDNWHLFGYLLLAMAVEVVPQIIEDGRWDLRVTTLFVLTLLLAFFGLFFLTDAGRWAEDFTSLNRIMLHFIPALLFWMLTVFVAPRTLAPSASSQRVTDPEAAPVVGADENRH